jgi:hypothetical protein
MRHLPIDDRGYPVPWFVAWINGKPEFRVMDHKKFEQAITWQRCWVCGHRLGREGMTFVIGPMCSVNRVSSEPPSHHRCAVFSAMACPFLTKPQMVRRENDLPEGHRPPAGVMIRRNPGVTCLWHTQSYRLNKVPGGVLFGLGAPLNVSWYACGRQATHEEVIESMRTGLPSLLDMARTEGDRAIAELRKLVAVAVKYIPMPERGREVLHLPAF